MSAGAPRIATTTAEEVLERAVDDRALRTAPASIAAVCERGEVRGVRTHGHPRADDGATTSRDLVIGFRMVANK